MSKIHDQSLKQHILKQELKWGMNNLINTYLNFHQIATNNGAETLGIDGRIIDDIDLNKLTKYHQKYVHNQYNPKLVKRVHIPKGKDKTRLLGIPTIQDRIIQKAYRIIPNSLF
ncbi:MAG: hypothetical protein Q8879_02055 [Candidatus Phytoplasma australasiaticum]|nr:hypothetical protein [Pigeon pea little leaf phytoplasma]MDV3197836.1 hypothetical protein [Candidatus Phytoplasma australasiaticum]